MNDLNISTTLFELTIEQKAELIEKFAFNIIHEWDFEKNNEDFPNISIMSIKPKSQYKIWWKCSQYKHRWQASMRHRTDGSLCPICSNRVLLTGFNDFATKFPELLEDWKKSGNNPDPSTILFSTSRIKIEWPCKNDHYFITTPSSIIRARGCNYCNGTKVLKGFNDLASKCSESLFWWDYEKNDKTPEEVRWGSKVKVWWKCLEYGHSYFAAINHFYNGRRCSTCAGKTIDVSNKLSITHPHLVKEWDFTKNSFNPGEISAGHDKKAWWKCSQCSHEWTAYVYNRTNKKRPQGCPECAKGATASRGEKQIIEFLSQNSVSDIVTHKIINNKEGRKFEIDIFIPHLNIGIEFNGIYYHSEKFVDKKYHFNKFKTCQENNIQLIQIWEDDWFKSCETIKQMLLNQLNKNIEYCPLEKTTIKKIEETEAIKFFSDNYPQKVLNASLYIGLLNEKQKLIAVVAVQERKSKKGLNISCFVSEYNSSNNFAKLISYIEKHYDFEYLTAISDNCIDNNELYINNGFKFKEHISPDYTYFAKKQYREDKTKYSKNKFKNDLNLEYFDKMNEEELAELNGFLKVYDAGKTKWVRKIIDE